MEHGNILITPGMAEQFPDLEQMIARLDQHNPNPDLPRPSWVDLAGSEQRPRDY